MANSIASTAPCIDTIAAEKVFSLNRQNGPYFNIIEKENKRDTKKQTSQPSAAGKIALGTVLGNVFGLEFQGISRKRNEDSKRPLLFMCKYHRQISIHVNSLKDFRLCRMC